MYLGILFWQETEANIHNHLRDTRKELDGKTESLNAEFGNQIHPKYTLNIEFGTISRRSLTGPLVYLVLRKWGGLKLVVFLHSFITFIKRSSVRISLKHIRLQQQIYK